MIWEFGNYSEYYKNNTTKGWKNMPEIISIGTGIIFMFICFGIVDEIMEREKEKRKNENTK